MVGLTSATSGSSLQSLNLQQTPTASTGSFVQQLTSALEAVLSQSGNGSRLEIDVEPVANSGGGSTAGSGRFVVTVKENPAPVSTGPVATTAAATPTLTPNLAAVSVNPAAAPAAQSVTASSPEPAGRRLADGKPVLNEADAYWASQPPEVQALRDLPDSQRMDLAHDLADRGFQIDVPIMVWNWDPLTTMMVRQNQGFTWVPSAKQNPVQVAPGLTFGGLPSYDPKNPPPGSIKVTTEFAKGLESTCPWLRDS
jgi:hypothetical protein